MKTVAYIRVSTDRQDVENQRFEITRYAKSNHLNVDEFVGEVISGYKTQIAERKFGQVLKELDRGDTLIVSETSRISRRLIDILNTLQDCIDKGITVIAVKEQYVFKDDLNSQIMAFAFGLAAQIERNLISARTREALARKKAEGVILGRPRGKAADPTKRKLHGQDDQILDYLEKRVPKAVIARLLDVNRQTLQNYIDQENLMFKLRQRRLVKLDNLNN
ncbi:recombinase family protein [Mycobacteroides abscessus]|uniref:recombinase family protein n=1 Tax=Mycobacteroides abscessus TaxID=36809 RepID=UPI000C2662E7|nr:recombinase family protein [Mycobacteroides abscessus]